MGCVPEHLLWVGKYRPVLIKTTSTPKTLKEVPVTRVIRIKKAEPKSLGRHSVLQKPHLEILMNLSIPLFNA